MLSPMYRQIAEDLREQIGSGGLRPGQQLQTELDLRERYGAPPHGRVAVIQVFRTAFDQGGPSG